MTISLADNEPPDNPSLSIGAVLNRLKPEFPDLAISKIRFLESEGLVTPHRTPSGYRQFSQADVARLRFVLAAQRDQYLPLKVIKDQLDAIDRGLEPASPEARLPRSLTVAPGPSPRDFAASTQVRMNRAELLAQSGLTATSLAELEQFGLVAAGPGWLFRRRLRAGRRYGSRTAGGWSRAPPPAVVPHRGRSGGDPDHPAGFRSGAPARPRCAGAGCCRSRPAGDHDSAVAHPIGEGWITARSRAVARPLAIGDGCLRGVSAACSVSM